MLYELSMYSTALYVSLIQLVYSSEMSNGEICGDRTNNFVPFSICENYEFCCDANRGECCLKGVTRTDFFIKPFDHNTTVDGGLGTDPIANHRYRKKRSDAVSLDSSPAPLNTANITAPNTTSPPGKDVSNATTKEGRVRCKLTLNTTKARYCKEGFDCCEADITKCCKTSEEKPWHRRRIFPILFPIGGLIALVGWLGSRCKKRSGNNDPELNVTVQDAAPYVPMGSSPQANLYSHPYSPHMSQNTPNYLHQPPQAYANPSFQQSIPYSTQQAYPYPNQNQPPHMPLHSVYPSQQTNFNSQSNPHCPTDGPNHPQVILQQSTNTQNSPPYPV